MKKEEVRLFLALLAAICLLLCACGGGKAKPTPPLPPDDDSGGETLPPAHLETYNGGETPSFVVPDNEVAPNNKDFQLTFEGDWEQLTVMDAAKYQGMAEEIFYEVYPRLWARWGCNRAPKSVALRADKDYDGIAASSGSKVILSLEWVNTSASQLDGPDGWFAHELAHCAQNYSVFQSSWWIENMANYARFRYYAYLSPSFLEQDAEWVTDLSNSERLRDWDYEPYGECLWFFAWLDTKYPTSKDGLGLIDSIDRAIKDGKVASDGGNTQSDAAFNDVVREISGYDNIEELRKLYVDELDSGQWHFAGFGSYADNYITENLPGLDNPQYPK